VTLAETQALFHAAVTGTAVDPAEVESCFAGTPALSAPDRLEIYAGMWFWRQVEALEAEFPALRACLGPERFQGLCRDYLRAHPSEHHDIGRLGRALAPFLRSHPARERADLGDLAELEWARSEVFLEAEAAAAGREVLSSLTPEAFAGAHLKLSPALRLLRLEHPAQESWIRAMRGEGAPSSPPAPTSLAVWRTGYEVFHAPLGMAEAQALCRARQGACLGEVCAAFAAEEDPARSAYTALASWLDEGWVVGIGAGDGR
jgi:hypothetical protein